MSSVEVCPVCDIAGCQHIRDRGINALGLIDLIGEFGAAVDRMIDDCETSGPVGAEVHVVEGHHLDKVSELLERIEALPFEEPGVILGPGAMLQTALKRMLGVKV